MASRFQLPFADVGSGISPSDGATLDFFDTGTSTRKNTFSNEALTNANANPVIANGDGVFPDIFIPDGGRYKVTLKDKNGVQIFEADPVVGGVSASLIAKTFDTVALMVASTELNIGDIVETAGYTTKGDGGDNQYEIVAAATGTDDGGSFIDLATHQAKGLFPGAVINVKQFGAVGDGAADDTTEVIAAFAFLSTNGSIKVPAGIYIVDATIDLTDKQDIGIFGDGWGASIIQRDNGTFGDTLLFTRTTPATQQARGLTIKDIQFFANVDVTTGATIHIKNGTRVNMDGFFLRNFHRGIHTEGIRDSRFDNFEAVSNEFHTTTRVTSAHVLIDAPTDVTKESTETFFSNFNWTTATGQVDLNRCLHIRGALDGIWFSNGHMFGGNSSGCVIDGNSQAELQGLTFDHVWFDQFTPRNLTIQGTATAKYRFITFNDCRFFGGSTNLVTTDLASNIEDVTFSGCEFGVTQGQGVQIGSGQILIQSGSFKALNQSMTANGYGVQTVASSAAGTILSVMGGVFECSNLTFGIQCVDTTVEYHFHDNNFRGQDGNIAQEILFNADVLTGTCAGNKTGRAIAGNIAAATKTTLSNIATDSYNLTGATVSIDEVRPTWHERRITLKADSATQNIITGGIMRNKGDASPLAILAADLTMYEFRVDSARWHEV